MQWLIVTSFISPFGKGCRRRGEVPPDFDVHSVRESVTSLFEATSRTKKADVWECLWAFRHIGYSLTGLPALPDYPLVSRPKCFIYGDVTHPTRVLHFWNGSAWPGLDKWLRADFRKRVTILAAPQSQLSRTVGLSRTASAAPINTGGRSHKSSCRTAFQTALKAGVRASHSGY